MTKPYLKNRYSSLIVNLTLMLSIVSVVCLPAADAQIGACYGTLGSNLPQPSEVLSLCEQHNISRIRIYNPNPLILRALQKHPKISVLVGVANEDIIGIAQDPTLAKSWVQNNILKYKHVKFRYIAVGNEIDPLGSIAPSVAPAMKNVQNALMTFGLGRKVKVSTALSMGVLGQSYPPSAGAFRPEIMTSFINPTIRFLARTGSPFLVNVFPYFAYISNPNDIRLDYALFTSPSTVVGDGIYEYQNLFNAMVDAVHAALEKAGEPSVEIVVSETGWPSAGGTTTSVETARTYNSNLIKNVEKGTPRRPRKRIETYIFDLIDEDQKSPELEKHWGLFLANKQLKYNLSIAM